MFNLYSIFIFKLFFLHFYELNEIGILEINLNILFLIILLRINVMFVRKRNAKSQVNYRMFGSATTIYRFSITHRIHMFLFRLVLLYFKCFEVPTTKISDISASFLILPHISKTFGPISTKPYFFDQIYRQQHEIINLLAI